MSYSSQLTKERILSCAKAEFLSKGFQNANMRTIAEQAKVTTGAMYNHFKNKELLFDALVGGAGSELIRLFNAEHEKSIELPSFFDGSTDEQFEAGFNSILDYIYDNFAEMKLLISHAAGTKHENFLEQMIAVEEKSTLQMLEKHGYPLRESDYFFVHIVSSSMMNNMFEFVRHNLNKQQANEYAKTFRSFYFAGFKEMLGL